MEILGVVEDRLSQLSFGGHKIYLCGEKQNRINSDVQGCRVYLCPGDSDHFKP